MKLDIPVDGRLVSITLECPVEEVDRIRDKANQSGVTFAELLGLEYGVKVFLIWHEGNGT